MSAIFPHDAAFPHDAVVQRYLHTGKRRSKRKIVVASVFGVVACVVVVAALPANSSKSGAGISPLAEQAKSVPAVPPATQDVASRIEAPPPPKVGVDASAGTAGTTGTAANQPNATPPHASVQTASNPPAPAAPASSPAVAAPAPQPDTQAANAPPPATADHAADVATPKHVATKLTRKARHRLTAAEKRNRIARTRAPQPTLVRVYDLPDGRRIYQRVRGDEAGLNYPGGEVRRVYLAPADRSVD